MTEKEIQLLGFTRNEFEESNYYYSYKVTGGLSFVTGLSDESLDDKWYVDIFNTEIPVRFTSFEKVQNLINFLEKSKVNEK